MKSEYKRQVAKALLDAARVLSAAIARKDNGLPTGAFTGYREP